MGTLFFFFAFLPVDDFMHLKRSFVTRELALHACTLSALPDGLYIIQSWKGRESGLHEGKKKKGKEYCH